MTVKLLAVLVALSMTFTLILAAPALAFHAVQDEGTGTISLNPVDDVPEQANGVATFRVRSDSDGFYFMKVRIRVKSLPERAGRVYEVWMIDDNTNHNLNLGVFDTDNDGDGSLSVTRTINSLALYDRIVVTSEESNDFDPGSEGTVVLEGEQH